MKFFISIKQCKLPWFGKLSGLLTTTVVILSVSACSLTNGTEPNNESFTEQRVALIKKHSAQDNTFAALSAQIKKNDKESSEYWNWRIDQYMYGQYPEYQAIYDAHKQGKSFQDIYQLPDEDLRAKKKGSPKLVDLPKGYFSDNLPGNPHTGWYEVVGNKVVITYQGELTDPYVASYDLETRQWQGPYKAGESTLSKGDRKIDSHGRPIIEQDSKGHFHIIYGGHGGEREDGLNPYSIDTPHAGGRMLHVMSEKPNDISKFVQVDDITPFASYTSSHKMDNGDIYFFTRAGTHKSPWVYYKMKSGEQRFEAPVIITWPTPQKADPIHVDTFYIRPMKVSATEIAISYLWHTCNFNEVHNKQTYGRINSYYMTLDTANDTFYNVKGETLTLPITLSDANKKTLAFDSTQREETPFSTKPLVLKDGSPALAYQARTKQYRQWRMTKFDGEKWQHSLPMPGTADRQLFDQTGLEITNVVSFQAMADKDSSNQALVVYKTQSGNSVFAQATKLPNSLNHWQITNIALELNKSKIELKAVRGEEQKLLAAVINVRKGASQRLYLWQDGQFRANP